MLLLLYEHPNIENGADLAAHTGFHENGVAINGMELWLESAPRDCSINLLDLFYWESRCGVWAAHSLWF